MGLLSEKNKDKKNENTIQSDRTAPDILFPPINGIDTVKGIAMTGGTAEGYRKVLSMFRKDAEERIQKFRYFLYESSSSGKFPEKHLASFITQIQALKSASATIGAAEISEKAARFEAASKNKELSYIQDNLPDFTEHLATLIKSIRSALESKSDKATAKSGGQGFISQVFNKKNVSNPLSSKVDSTECFPLFGKLAEALGSKNVKDAEQVLDELNKIPLDPKTKEIMEQISDQVLMTEFESAVKTINGFIGIEKINSFKQARAIMETDKKLIFLVDDNPANLRIGKNVLSEKYTVATAPSASKLFNLLENNRPVLILLDIDMPGMDGYDAIKILKLKQETKDIPVIFLTGMIDSNNEEKGRSLGAADYITKPFDPKVLIACLNKYC
jgi:CheY-like chemotaxis protein